MIFDKKISKKNSIYLLQVNAIKLNSKNPFNWSSGWKSPIYCDNRLVLSYPEIRSFIVNEISKKIKSLYKSDFFIAGVATGAIGLGALIAEQTNAPFIYVRPEPKKHGRKNQIEGVNPKGKKVVIIEDLISTGLSSIKVFKTLKKEGAEILAMFSIFDYGFEISKKNFDQINLSSYSLTDYKTLIETAIELKYIKKDEVQNLMDWRLNPSKWKSIN
ncbi:MAG: orotate phosphoribosyltransferase [Flavobacteriaceae bacterium]|nr:orotate phosphoribosyltransferase [Flavobacteriaceae bacterium]